MVDKVFYQNTDKYPSIVNDYRQVRDGIENFHDSSGEQSKGKKSVVLALEALPPVRRVVSIPDKVEKGEVLPALGMAGLALINLPEDCRDIKSAYNQVKAAVTGGEYKAPYVYKDYQHGFSFFKGTAIEAWIHKKENEGKRWAKWLLDNDKTVADTSFGRNVIEKLGAEQGKPVQTTIKKINGDIIFASKYEGKAFGTITARAMKRTTVLGLLVMGLLEAPKIIKAASKGDGVVEDATGTLKQTVKSGINVASITAGMAYGGAIGSKYGKAFGSIAGMGLGAILGSKLSEQAQKIISD